MNTTTSFKLIADADLNEDLIRGLRRTEASIDFLTASDGGTRGLLDRQVLELAAAAGRVLVSHDRNTMVGEFYRFITEGLSSPGLIIVDQELDEGDAIDDLLLIWAASSLEELRNRVRWVPIRSMNG
jgi:predicted nuclease of predicted toxin-antitoxin system